MVAKARALTPDLSLLPVAGPLTVKAFKAIARDIKVKKQEYENASTNPPTLKPSTSAFTDEDAERRVQCEEAIIAMRFNFENSQKTEVSCYFIYIYISS